MAAVTYIYNPKPCMVRFKYNTNHYSVTVTVHAVILLNIGVMPEFLSKEYTRGYYGALSVRSTQLLRCSLSEEHVVTAVLSQ